MTGKIELNLCGTDCEVSYTVRKAIGFAGDPTFYYFQFPLKGLPLLFLLSFHLVEFSKQYGASENIWFHRSGRCIRWGIWVTRKDRKKISAIIKNYIVKDML